MPMIISCTSLVGNQQYKKKTPTEKKTSEWYNENFLKGNLSKHQTMIISKQEWDFLDIVIDGMTIKATDYHHYMCHYCSQPSPGHADVLRGSSRVPVSSYKKA